MDKLSLDFVEFNSLYSEVDTFSLVIVVLVEFLVLKLTEFDAKSLATVEVDSLLAVESRNESDVLVERPSDTESL
ncbi:MAG: hypothetical protein ABF754_07495, partial [Leuconostoc pseudomesenteroides]